MGSRRKSWRVFLTTVKPDLLKNNTQDRIRNVLRVVAGTGHGLSTVATCGRFQHSYFLQGSVVVYRGSPVLVGWETLGNETSLILDPKGPLRQNFYQMSEVNRDPYT